MESLQECANCLMLYAEDDTTTRDLIITAIRFKFPRMTVLPAENGRRGLELYKEHRPDIVLTDIQMPVMDGLTMAAEIRMVDPVAIICFISAYCDVPQYMEKADELAVYCCVPKPVDYSVLFSTMEKCFAEATTRHDTKRLQTRA